MNIFNKVALQGLKKSRTRTLVTIIGVALSSALITAVATFGVSLLHYMASGAAQKYGGWHVAFLDVDSAFVQQQQQDPAVADTVTFENIGYAAPGGAKEGAKPYLFLAGFSQDTFDALPITLLSGRLPQTSSEVVVSGRVASQGGLHYALGDTITLAVGRRTSGDTTLGQHDPYQPESETLVPQAERSYTVVGICQSPSFEEDCAPGYTLITCADAAPASEDLSVFVTLQNPRSVHTYAAASAAGHAYFCNNSVLRFLGLSEDAGDQLFNTLLFTVGGIVVAIIMVGSVFLIYNSFHISLNERTQQFGILASVGATPKQLRSSVLFEGLCIGAVGIPIGILLGIGSIGLVLRVVSQNFRSILYSNVPLTLTVSFYAVIGAAVVSLITILISAYLPAKKAAGMPVMECIRQTGEIKVESKAVEVSPLAQRMYGLEGTLALKNFKRNKKRYRSIVLSLILSVVLFISTSAFVGDLEQASQQAKAVTSYDIGFGTQEMDDDALLQLYDTLKTADGVTESAYQVAISGSCTVPADALSAEYWAAAGAAAEGQTVSLPVGIQFLDDASYSRLLQSLGLPEQSYTGPNAKALAVAQLQGSSAPKKDAPINNMFVCSDVDISLSAKADAAPGTAQACGLTFVEFVPPDIPPTLSASASQGYYFQILMPYSRKATFAPTDASADILVKGCTFQSETPAQTTAEMQAMAEGCAITASYLFLNSSSALDESRNYIFIANVFAYTFIVVISLIAVANVFNTISTNIKLRRRELAMLRSVGMSDRSFNRMMRFECAFYGMRALAFGLPLAAAASWLIYKGMFIGGAEGIVFSLPWGSIGLSVCSVLLVIFVTMMYAVRTIKKENIIDALRDDMA